MSRFLFLLLILSISACGSVDSASKNKKALDFEWDFSEQKKIVYSFNQTTDNINREREDSFKGKHFFTGEGVLGIRIKENNLADLSLTSLEIKSIDQFSASHTSDTSTQELPPLVVQDMKPDGNFSDPNIDMMFSLLFPIPNKRLKIGDSCSIPMQFPFNANGSRLLVKGENVLTFVGYEEIDGVDCAVLSGAIDISKLDVPEELEGEFASSAIGKATYYLDVDRRIYIGSDIQMTMKAFMDSGKGEEDVFDLFMDMTSKNEYKIRFKEIQE